MRRERLATEVAKARIIEFYRVNKRWPTASKCKGDNEKHLAHALYRMHSASDAKARDPEFISAIKALGWESREDKVSERKAQIWRFHAKRGRFPHRDSGPPGERKLGGYFLGYVCTTHSSFDSDFLLKAIDLGYRPLSNSRSWDVPEIAARLKEVK